MPRTKTTRNPGASSSRSLPPRQATHHHPVDPSDSDSVEDDRQPSLSPVANDSKDMDQDYQEEDPGQVFQEAPCIDLHSIKDEDFMMLRHKNQYEMPEHPRMRVFPHCFRKTPIIKFCAQIICPPQIRQLELPQSTN